MNGCSRDNAQLLSVLKLDESSAINMGVAVPYPYLAQARSALCDTSIVWGAQDVSSESGGSRTGEISALMLADMGCDFVIVGHSERRQYHGESDALIAQKAQQAIDKQLRVVFCFGETQQQRIAEQTQQVIESQVSNFLHSLNQIDYDRIIFAYEPVWAIGTGVRATEKQAQQVHASVRRLLPVELKQSTIIYGGSVTADHSASLFVEPDIDGALVGGASLNADTFNHIANNLGNSFGE